MSFTKSIYIDQLENSIPPAGSVKSNNTHDHAIIYFNLLFWGRDTICEIKTPIAGILVSSERDRCFYTPETNLLIHVTR